VLFGGGRWLVTLNLSDHANGHLKPLGKASERTAQTVQGQAFQSGNLAGACVRGVRFAEAATGAAGA
jgi:hypothetical protein